MSSSGTTPTEPGRAAPARSPTATTAPATLPAWASRAAWCRLMLVLVLALATDLVSKQLAFDRIAPNPVELDRQAVLHAAQTEDGVASLIPRHRPVTVIPSVLDLTLVLNRGAVFGLGQGQRWLFVAFTAVALGVGLWAFAMWTQRHQWLTHASLGLVLGGGLGNLYDRIVFACVRDFLHPLPGVSLPFGLRWPSGSGEVWPYVSNLADLYLILGIAGLVGHLWRAERDHRSVSPADSPERAAPGSGPQAGHGQHPR